MPLVYLCGPIIGQTYQEARFGWRQSVADRLEGADIECLSPMRQESHLAINGNAPLSNDTVKMWNNPWTHDRTVFRKDVIDIRRCDLVLANLMGASQISKGSLVEIGMAYALLKPIVVIIEHGNPHEHPFVSEAADILAADLEEGIEAVKILLTPGV